MSYYDQFVKANMPTTVKVGWMAFEEVCDFLGLEVRATLPEGLMEIRHPRGDVRQVWVGEIELPYHIWEIRGDSLVFEVCLAGMRWWPKDDFGGPYPDTLLRNEFVRRFAQPVIIPLPERVVDLPVPSWAIVYDENEQPLNSRPRRMFLSEARALWDSFSQEVSRALE